MKRCLVAMCVLSAGVSLAGGPKPAAVQVCFKTPAGLELFSSKAEPYFRSLNTNTWMLDFDVLLDGEKPEKVTKAGSSCVRAWTAARAVKRISVSFERVPLNYVVAERAVDLQLKPDLWFDAGTVVLEQEPFAVAKPHTGGELKFERKTSSGLVTEKSDALPVGEYVVTHVAAPEPTKDCSARVEVVAMGTVTAEKSPALLKDLTLHYADNVLPAVLSQKKFACTDSEEVVAEVLLVDGVFVRSMQPKLSKVAVPARQTVFELRHDDKVLRLDEPVSITIAPGQVLEVIAKKPPVAAR